MPDTFDVTAEQAARWNRLIKGEAVDVHPEEVDLFKKLADARARRPPPPAASGAAEPGLMDRAAAGASALGEGLKGLVTQTKPDFAPIDLKEPQRAQFPDDRSYIEAVGLYGQHLAGRSQSHLAAARLNAMSGTLAGLEGANPLGLRIDDKNVTPEMQDKAYAEAAARNPKSVLAGGLVGPNAETVPGRIAQQGVTGALGAKMRGQDPLAGGLENAGAAAAMELLMHGGGKLVSPLLKNIHERAAMGEPVTDVSPLALDERRTAVGEPPTQVDPANLLHPFEPPSPAFESTSPSLERPGIATKAERPYFKDLEQQLTKTGPLSANEFPPEPKTLELLDPRNAPSEHEKVQAIDALLEKEGRVPASMDPTLKPGGSYYDAGNHDYLQGQFGRERIPSTEKTVVQGRDNAGTRSMKVPVQDVMPQTKFDEALNWLEGKNENTALSKTKTRYVPRDLNAPEHIARDPEATHIPSREVPPREAFIMGGSGGGENPQSRVVAGPPVEPTPLTPDDVPDNFFALAGESQDALARDRGIFEKLKQAISLPENRAGSEVAAAIRGLRASRAIHDVAMEKLFPRLQESLKRLTPSERATAQKVVVGLRDRKMGIADISKLPEEFRGLFVQQQREQQSMMLDLAKKGYFSAKELAGIKKTLDNGQLYLHRSYQAFLAKKGFTPTAAAMEKAARFFADEEGIDGTQAFARVRAVMKELQEKGFSSPAQVAQAFRDSGLLKKRSLPPQLRGLLGVVNDPSFVVADTSAELAQMYHQARVTEAMAAPQFEGVVWSNDWRPGMDERRMWNDQLGLEGNRRAYGALAGKYVAPQLREAMVNFSGPQARSFVAQLSNAAVNWFSFAKVITSPTTLARNLLSNSFNLMVSGVPMHRWPQLIGQAAMSLRADAKKLGLREAGAGEWARMALEDNATPQGRGTDWGGAESRRIIEDVIRESPKGLVSVFDTLFRKYNGARAYLGKVYEMGDTVPRLAAYIYHVNDGVKTLGLGEAAARARASHIVNRYFATGASVGPAFRGMSQSGLAPFGSWFVDNMRVTKNIAADAARGQFGPLMRAGLFAGIPPAMFYGLRQYYGVTDAEVSAAERRLKGSWRDRNAFHDWLPIRGKDGLMYAVSFDGLNPLSVFFKGPEGSMPKAIAANVMQGMTQSGWAEPFMDLTLAKLGVAPQAYQAPVLPGQEGWRMANDLYSYMQPTLMKQFTDVARKAQLAPDKLPLRNEEPQSLGEAALTTFNPLSIEKVGPRTMEATRKQGQGAFGELNDAKKQAKKLPVDEKTRVQQEAQRRIEELRKRQSSR